jgi:hypothetical protein
MTETSSVTDTSVSSDGIAEMAPIEQRLRCRLGHRVHDLQIWVEPHGLIVAGRTGSYYDKQMAQHLVREISSRDVADNQIVGDSRLAELSGGHGGEFQRHRVDHGPVARHQPTHRHDFAR